MLPAPPTPNNKHTILIIYLQTFKCIVWLFFAYVLLVGGAMPRGRPATLKNRKTTTVSIESQQAEFILKKGIDLSKLVRDAIDVLMQSEETRLDQLNREIEELENEKQEREIQLFQKKNMRNELLEARTKEEEEYKLLSEFEANRKEYVLSCVKMMQTQTTYTRFWMEHLTKVWKFNTFDEAKTYVRDVWLEGGVPAKRVKEFLKIELINTKM